MEQEQYNEFSQLQEAVTAKLRSSTYRTDHVIRRQIQILVLPSFDDPYVWEVFQKGRRNDINYELVHVCWRRDFDRVAFESPVNRLKYPHAFKPTIETRIAMIASETIINFLHHFRQIAVPLAVPDAPAGLDGTSYELAVGTFWCSARIRWWVRLPSQWAQLQSPLDSLLMHFKQLLPETPQS